MREPNTLLDALLDEAGMSRAGLAARVNQAAAAGQRTAPRYDHTSVGRWLAGQRPRDPVSTLICEALSTAVARPLTLEDIGMGVGRSDPGSVELHQFINRAPALWRSDRRDNPAVRDSPLVTGLDAIAPIWQWENPPDDHDVSRHGTGRIGADDVELITAARQHYEQMYRRIGGIATRTRLVRFLGEHAAPILRGSYSNLTGRDVHHAIGALLALAGICAHDADRHGLAQRYFHQALRLAKASGDRAFGAYIIALLTNQALFHRDYRQAVAFAEAALRTANGTLTPALAADLHAMQAKAFARMRQPAQAHHAMHQAEHAADLIGQPGQPAEPPETDYVQPGLVDTHLAEALLALGDLTAAHEHAHHAAALGTHPRGQVNRLVTVTRVAVAERDLDRAAEAATTMLTLARGMESARLNDRFRVLADTLRHHPAAATRTAVEQLDHATRLPL
jgi:hypothetical protein